MTGKPPAAPHRDWLGLKHDLPPRRRFVLALLSFALPLALWCLVSYVPWVWHPLVRITSPGEVEYFSTGMDVPRADFARENRLAAEQKTEPAQGYRVNPPYLPPPHAVARAFVTAFQTPPRLPNEPWLYQSLGHSIRTICWAFLASSLLGVPLGILAGAYRFFSWLQEPFIEFFRYLPAPAFGALCVAVLGIYDPPKIAIIFIGTFFQQVLIIANTVRRVDPTFIEAAQTLGASRGQLLWRVVIPASVVEIYADMRILLGWAWTYLIVAEVVGTMSGITYFINQQARYRNFPNVYAAIAMIGIIGLSTDFALAWVGRLLFPWKRASRRAAGVKGLQRVRRSKPGSVPFRRVLRR